MCTCNIYDRIRSAFGLKSASTPKISIHWNHNLKSLRVSVWHRSWEIIWHCCQNGRLFQNKWPKRPTHVTYASDMWSSILQFVHNIFWLKLMWNARSKLFYFISGCRLESECWSDSIIYVTCAHVNEFWDSHF
jgi:hypothetical protein